MLLLTLIAHLLLKKATGWWRRGQGQWYCAGPITFRSSSISSLLLYTSDFQLSHSTLTRWHTGVKTDTMWHTTLPVGEELTSPTGCTNKCPSPKLLWHTSWKFLLYTILLKIKTRCEQNMIDLLILFILNLTTWHKSKEMVLVVRGLAQPCIFVPCPPGCFPKKQGGWRRVAEAGCRCVADF